MSRPAEGITRIELRLPDDLRDAAKGLADANERSMNWMLVALIREALAARTKRRRK